MALVPVNRPRKITSVDMWMRAFHVFVGVYGSRFPQEAPGLMKYVVTIQVLVARRHNWRFYDENFRFYAPESSNVHSMGNCPLGAVAKVPRHH